MKLALDDAGHPLVEDGKPVYEHADGKRAPFDAAHTLATISRLNGEAKSHREAKEALESRVKAFEGIDDPEAARRALQTVSNLDQGQLVTAGKVEEVREAARRAAEEQVRAAAEAGGRRLKELQGERDRLIADLYAEKVGGAFSRSRFIADKVAVPPDMIQAMFGSRFKVEDGGIVGYDAAGNKIYSRAKPGEVAEFDEALEMMVDAYAYRDAVLKGSGSTGSGATPRSGGSGGGRTMKKAAFDALPPLEQAVLMSGKDRPQLVD